MPVSLQIAGFCNLPEHTIQSGFIVKPPFLIKCEEPTYAVR
jgi:hypothetical protein